MRPPNYIPYLITLLHLWKRMIIEIYIVPSDIKSLS